MASSAPIEEVTTPERISNASTFARVGLLVYTFLIIYASWYPFSGWSNNGLSPWHYFSAPLPHYWTRFDFAANVLAYIPLGIGIIFALYPHVRRVGAFVIAVAVGTLLSALIEAGQTYLPSRVPSNLDLITNAFGALVGAITGLALTRPFLEQSRFLTLRSRWFSHEASRGLIVVSLWPLAQIYPQAYLFGHGQVTPILSAWLSKWMETPIDLAALLRPEAELTVEQYWLSETIITTCGLVGGLLTMLCLLRKAAPKVMLLIVLASSAIFVKSLASALLFSPQHAFVWLTPGAQAGIVVSAIMLGGLAFAPPIIQRRVAALALITGLVVVNVAPSNPYFVATLQSWTQGKFLNFNGATQFLSLAWPFVALWFLYHPVHRSVKQK